MIKISNAVLFCLMCSLVCSIQAEESLSGNQAQAIIKMRNDLVLRYETDVTKKNYKDAFYVAKELLKIDPSDTVSYLRLSIAANNLKLNGKEIKRMYGSSASESNMQEKEIKSLANAFLN